MTGNQVFTSNPGLRSRKWRGRYPIIARQLPRLFCSLYELYAGNVHSMDPLNLSKYPTCSSGDNPATQEALSDVTRRHDLNNVAWHLRLSYRVLSGVSVISGKMRSVAESTVSHVRRHFALSFE